MNHDKLRKDIAERAYYYFLARGGEHGRDVDDWLRAERELLDNNKPRKTARKKSTTKSRKTTKTTTKRRPRASAKV